MTTTTDAAVTAKPKPPQRPGDRWFSGIALAAGAMILVTLAAVAIFLIIQSAPGITATNETASILRSDFWDYVWPLAFGTIWAALLALLMAVPLSVAVALFISHYAPRRLAQGLGYVVDLLAAVPSVVFGLWGILVLAPAVLPVYMWLNTYMGWFPLFSGTVSGTGRTIFTAAIVLAVMVVPIITAICREIFLQTPVLHAAVSSPPRCSVSVAPLARRWPSPWSCRSRTSSTSAFSPQRTPERSPQTSR